VRTSPISVVEAASYFGDLWIAKIVKTLRQLKPTAEPAAA
jgi:hypothetical protein